MPIAPAKISKGSMLVAELPYFSPSGNSHIAHAYASAIQTTSDTTPAIDQMAAIRATGVTSGGMACTTYQNDSDCRPSTTAIGTANSSDQFSGAPPPNTNTTVSSKPNTTHTPRYDSNRPRCLKI